MFVNVFQQQCLVFEIKLLCDLIKSFKYLSYLSKWLFNIFGCAERRFYWLINCPLSFAKFDVMTLCKVFMINSILNDGFYRQYMTDFGLEFQFERSIDNDVDMKCFWQLRY